jgi:pimeloyl-ACP methyl ester carboxylesterase
LLTQRLNASDFCNVGVDWVTYKDFRDATPFVEGFLNNAERPISRHFAGRLDDLRKACAELTGRPFQAGISADLVMKLDALPKVPVLLVFNDQDEDFPAHCALLFEKRAEKYLDMECLAITGWALSEWLKQRASKY